MSSQSLARNAAASFKPLLPSPRFRLSTKPLTSSSPRRSVCASASSSRRDFLLLIPSLAAASAVLRPLPAAADGEASPPPPAESPTPTPPPPAKEKEPEGGDELAVSRVYDATVIGEPQAVGREGFRERLLADPKFLQRLAIEEAISITTTLLAQYERRKGRFFEEIDYVLTDTIRGSVVDFFTVWLPAPTISVLSFTDDESGQSLGFVKGLLGSLPDNAFQKNTFGQNWNMNQRVAAVIVGGLKLAGVGFISSVGAGVSSDLLYAARGVLKPSGSVGAGRKRAPILKSAAVYSGFLGTSANLRYQIIAGLLEHRLGESLATRYNQPLLAGLLSFVARTVNSYLGTQQWVDLARYTGLQKIKEPLPSDEVATPPETSQLEGSRSEAQNSDDSISSGNADQSSDPTK